jgi:hypothetical protein
MPGLRKTPVRPLLLPTFSRDKLCLSSGSGIAGILFGVIFSCAGLVVLAGLGYMLLGALGIVPPRGNINSSDMPTWKLVLCYLGVIAIASAHLFFGSLLLRLTHRVTIDRALNTVKLRTGWLGLRCERRQLDKFQSVGIVSDKSETAKNSYETFTIVLRSNSGPSFNVGKVTRSHKLAQDVASEVSRFTGKPIVDESAEMQKI